MTTIADIDNIRHKMAVAVRQAFRDELAHYVKPGTVIRTKLREYRDRLKAGRIRGRFWGWAAGTLAGVCLGFTVPMSLLTWLGWPAVGFAAGIFFAFGGGLLGAETGRTVGGAVGVDMARRLAKLDRHFEVDTHDTDALLDEGLDEVLDEALKEKVEDALLEATSKHGSIGGATKLEATVGKTSAPVRFTPSAVPAKVAPEKAANTVTPPSKNAAKRLKL